MREQSGAGGNSGGVSPIKNSMGATPPGGGSHEQSETVRYINKSENPDYEIPEEHQ